MADAAVGNGMVPAPLPHAHDFAVGDVVLAFHGQLLYEAKILGVGPGAPAASYTVHYQGWKMSWDEVVDRAAVVIHNDENLRYAHELLSCAKARQKRLVGGANAAADAAADTAPAADDPPPARARGDASDGDESDGEKRVAANAAAPAHATASVPPPKEETFVEGLFRMPSMLRRAAVVDWGFVNKDSQLVPLPRTPSVADVLKGWETESSIERDAHAVREVVTSLIEYFDALLPTLLLYKFEQLQFEEYFRDAQEAKEGVPPRPSTVYGMEHLNRLFIKLPMLLDQADIHRVTLQGIASEVNSLMLHVCSEHEAYAIETYMSPTEKYVETIEELKTVQDLDRA